MDGSMFDGAIKALVVMVLLTGVVIGVILASILWLIFG